MKTVNVKFKKLHKDAVIPSYAHDGDVGMDLTAISVEYDEKMDMYIYHTGLAVETEKGYGILLFPRSSNRKTDAYLCNHVGVVDSAIYRGEIMLCFKNRDSLRQLARESQLVSLVNSLLLNTDGLTADAAFKSIDEYKSSKELAMDVAPYKVGDRVAQMVVVPYPKVNVEVVEELTDTDRGEGGFGSTGN